MCGNVAVVTDSTASLPSWVTEELEIFVVPLRVRIGDVVDNEDRVDRSTLFDALRTQRPVGTAEPESAAFFWTYQAAMEAGAKAVVSVHISSRLSRTCESARDAAARSPIPVSVVDSLTSGMSLGFQVVAVAQAARSGKRVEDIVRTATARRPEHEQLIYVDTLEYLRRGGRIGAASAMVGTALSIKPLLGIADGDIVPLTRVRGTERALARLIDIGTHRAQGRDLDAAVEHVDASERAEELADRLRARMPNLRQALVTPASAVLTAHLGPGAVGLALAPY